MSGWWVVVDPRSPAERDASDDKMSPLLASWEAGVSNMQWLKDLVREGKATQHSFNGYPNRFTVRVRDCAPFIIGGPPQTSGRNTNVTVHADRFSMLPTEHMLTVDVWDQT